MNAEPAPPRQHEDADLFREAVRFTAAQTGFPARLIEKDYFCTVILAHLTRADPALVFKGGTCLAKVYTGFHRMSEDLDLVLPMPIESTRNERRRRSSSAKEAVRALPLRDRALRIARPLEGANESLQYLATIVHDSLLARQEEAIQVEIGLREPLLAPSVTGRARTLLLDPVSGRAWLEPLALSALSLEEALAEKYRAALSRREVAIRDFFDLDHAHRAGRLRPEALAPLVRKKLDVPGNDAVDVSQRRKESLRSQLQAALKPVLRAEDLHGFELERAWQLVTEMARHVAG
jgi:predicted nucleotidyltransferase component of viral defense system